MILSMLEPPGVELPLGVVGLGIESVHKVCSGHHSEWKDPVPLAVWGLLSPLGAPITPSVGQMLWPPTCDPGCVGSPGVELPLGVVKLWTFKHR